MKQFHDIFWLTFSVHVYQGLFCTLPTEFRRDHGRDMLQVFRDCCRHAYRNKGSVGVLGELVVSTFDLLINAIRERITALFSDNRRMFAGLTISMLGFIRSG